MKQKYIALFSLMIILAFIAFIVYDTITSRTEVVSGEIKVRESAYPDKWFVFNSFESVDGALRTVTVSEDGDIFTGGDSFISCFDRDLSKKWSLKTSAAINTMSVDGDTLFAASGELIYLISRDGKLIAEWGPYEAKSIITSLSAYGPHVAFADAGTKRVFVLDKKGEVKSMIGQADNRFIIPSPYFDVALMEGNTLFIANTGQRRIETWTTDGKFISQFGEPGTAPGSFCGCCNPVHFVPVPQGFITAEKGINRIKILDADGKFIEFVSAKNNFTPSVPLDLASPDGMTIYAANPVDSKVYIFKRR